MSVKVPAIFKNSQFLRLWGNQILLQVSFNMCNYTALLILADRTHSPFTQAQLYAALTLPAFVFGIVAGPVVDMTDRKKLMISADLLLSALFLSYAFSGAQPAIIMAIAFLTSSVARFFIPAEAATIPLLVFEETLEHANTFFLFTLLGSVILGYAIAGPVISIFGGLRTIGETAPFILSSVLLLVGFGLISNLKKIELARPEIPGTIFGKTFLLFLQTVLEVRRNKGISTPLALLVFVEFLIGTLSILILEYVRRFLSLPLTSVSYVLMGPLVLGLILGVLVLPEVKRRYGQKNSIIFACFLVGVLLFLLGLIPFLTAQLEITRAFTMISAFVMGICMVVIAVQARTILQLNARREMQGRVFSFLDIMIALITPVPVLILGFLADKISILAILLAIGILIMVIVAVRAKSSPHKV